MENTSQYTLAWTHIEASLNTLQEVDGGYSHAHRGIITLSDGNKAFVKIGVDENTKKWATKEIETYHLLQSHDYPYIPTLLAANTDNTAFALEALPSSDHWDWTDTWTEERLAATLKAMDALSEIALNPAQVASFNTSIINETQDGWKQLLANTQTQRILDEKMRLAGRNDIADTLDIAAEVAHSASFKFTRDVLVHNDVRADNCAWNLVSKEIRLVDWNWAELGDPRIDVGAFLVNVHKAGLDVTQNYADRLDKDALQWLAGYWLNAATQPLWPSASEKSTVRDYQLSSGIAALDLMSILFAIK